MNIIEEKENDKVFSIIVKEDNKECQIDCFDDSKEYKYKNCLYTNNFELEILSEFLILLKKYSENLNYVGIVIELDFFNEKSVEDVKKLKKLEDNIYFYEF